MTNELQQHIYIKLDKACKIAGIKPEDIKAGKYTIEKREIKNETLYFCPQKKIALVRVVFTDKWVYVRRLRRIDYFIAIIKSCFKCQ